MIFYMNQKKNKEKVEKHTMDFKCFFISFWPNLKYHQQRCREIVLVRFIIILRNQDEMNEISVSLRPKVIQHAELISMTVTVSCLTSDSQTAKWSCTNQPVTS